MSDLTLFENLQEMFLPAIASILIIKFGIIFLQRFIPNFFGICLSNNKTSLYHKPMLRGLGIIFPIACIPFLFNIIANFEIHHICLVFLSTFIGFWDDKKNLNQKEKLVLIYLLGLSYLFVDYLVNIDNSPDILNYFLNSFYFLFLLLFFNQVDGINGLAAATFIVLLLILSSIIRSFLLIVPFIVIISYYLFINIRGKIGIQGEAGSFFLGTISFIIIQSFELPLNNIFIFFLILPILCDISSTTIVRWIYGEKLLQGHNNNLYQRLVFKYKSHLLVTTSFSFTQLIFGFLFLKLSNLYSDYQMLLILISISIVLFFIFFYLAFLIQTKRILS